MIKLNRTSEYGLLALRHISKKGVTISAREVADTYGLPFEITAKTLQRLKDTGLIQSAQGARGGYTLNRELKKVSLAEFLQLMEGGSAVVACTAAHSENNTCEYYNKCEIKNLMTGLNQKVLNFLNKISLSEITDPESNPNQVNPT